MALSRFVLPFADVGSGIKPSDGALLYFFETGTSTPTDTFNVSTGGAGNENTNPVVADSTGVFPDIFLEGTFKVRLENKNNVQKWEVDPYQSLSDLSKDNLGEVASYTFATISDIDNSIALSGESLTLKLNDRVVVEDYATGNNSGLLFFTLVAAGTGTADGGQYIDLPTLGLQLKQNLHTLPYRVKAWGAVGSGLVDDWQPITSALDYLSTLGSGAVLVSYRRSGSRLAFDNGTYRTEAEIIPKPGVYILEGTGRFHVYPQLFEIQPDCLSTIMPVHTGRNCITIDPGNDQVSLITRDINLATLETGDVPTAGIGFKVGTEFNRDYSLDRTGIFGFESALDVYNAGGSTGIATLNVKECAINRNENVMRTLDGQIINILNFIDNEAGQNTKGLNIAGHVINIRGNSLESNDDAIKITGSRRGSSIVNNYFEACGGDFNIYADATKGLVVGPNFHNGSTALKPLYFRHDRDTDCRETDLMPTTDGSVNLETRGDLIKPSTDLTFEQAGASVARFWDNSMLSSLYAQGLTEIGGVQLTNPTSFHKNILDSAGSLRTTSGSGNINFVTAVAAQPIGTWISVSILVTYDDDVLLFPRMDVRLNGNTATNGGHNAQFAEWDQTTDAGTDKFKNKTILYTVYAKALTEITSITTVFYAAGLNPAPGETYVTSSPMVTSGLTDGAFTPFMASRFINQSTAFPTSGDWNAGQKMYNLLPQAGERIGWVCTNGGTPGTWKGFGTIDA